MNNNNIFLQLRQKEAEEVYKNGDFATQLRRPIVLEEGDQIIVNKSIIDSRGANAGKIVLENDTTIGFHMYYYVINFDIDEKWTDFGRTVQKTQANVDNNFYVGCAKETPAGYEVEELTEIKYKVSDGSKTKESIIAKIQYTDLGGTKVIHPINLPYNGNNGYYERDNLTLRARRTGSAPPFEVFLDVSNPDELFAAGTFKSNREITTQIIGTNTQYFPVLSERSIV
ncbi:MAG: hypothetical protein ACR2M9_03960, partial [Cyanophyceae cyanobacterium]